MRRSARGPLPGRADYYAAMTEATLQTAVEQLLAARRWRYYHAPDNRPGPGGYVQNVKAGFPDLVVLDPGSAQRTGPRLVVLELKRQRNSLPTGEQLAWLAHFAQLGAYVAVIRPSHLDLVRSAVVSGRAWPAVDPVTFEPG